MDTKQHWEKIYTTKQPHEVSWTQAVPKTSLDFLHGFRLSKDSPIIDIGGGESRLADFLLDEGFTDITVLDISEAALQRAKDRLGDRASNVQWIVADVTEFKPMLQYHVWHDRATFHFLTTEEQILKYVSLASNHIDSKGYGHRHFFGAWANQMQWANHQTIFRANIEFCFTEVFQKAQMHNRGSRNAFPHHSELFVL